MHGREFYRVTKGVDKRIDEGVQPCGEDGE